MHSLLSIPSNFPRVITLSGLANSGKNSSMSAAGAFLQGYAQEDCSLIVRAMARERGMVFEEFVERVTRDPGFMPDYDQQIDCRAIEFMRKPPVIIAGRIQHWVARGLGIESFNVCLDATPDVRAERGFRKGGIPHDDSHRRDQNDLKRYGDWDLSLALPAEVGPERHQVHMSIFTEAFSVEEVGRLIFEGARRFALGEPFDPRPGYVL